MTLSAPQRPAMVMSAFAVLTGLLVVLGYAESLQYLFAAAALAIGLWLFLRHPVDYVVFSLLLWIVTPAWL